MKTKVQCLKVLEVHLFLEKTKWVLSESLLEWLTVPTCHWTPMFLETSCVPEQNPKAELLTHRLVLCTVISIDGILKLPMHQSCRRRKAYSHLLVTTVDTNGKESRRRKTLVN